MRVVKLRKAGKPQVVVSHENITQVVKAQEDIKKKEAELSRQKKMLEDSNTALEVLLEHREQDRVRLEENVLANIRMLVMPYLEKLQFQKHEYHHQTGADAKGDRCRSPGAGGQDEQGNSRIIKYFCERRRFSS
jgi:hypothetical protein